MNTTNTWIGVGILAVVIIAGGAYFTLGKAPVENAENIEGGTTAGNTSPAAQSKKSLKALLSGGQDVKCTFEQSVDTADSSGTVYISDGKMRGEFKSVVKASGQTVDSSMIVKDNTAYVWANTMPMGVKMSFSEVENAQTQGSSASAPNISQELDYRCQGWSPDVQMFELPKGVSFNTLPSMPQSY